MNIWGSIFVLTTFALWLLKRERQDKSSDKQSDGEDLEKEKPTKTTVASQPSIKDAYFEMMCVE